MEGFLLFTARFFEESGVESARQQVAHFICFHLPAQVGERDGGVATELPDNLSARPARRRQCFGIGHDGDPLKMLFAFRKCFPDGDALGAHSQAEARALDIAARENLAVVSFNCRADAEV